MIGGGGDGDTVASHIHRRPHNALRSLVLVSASRSLWTNGIHGTVNGTPFLSLLVLVSFACFSVAKPFVVVGGGGHMSRVGPGWGSLHHNHQALCFSLCPHQIARSAATTFLPLNRG